MNYPGLFAGPGRVRRHAGWAVAGIVLVGIALLARGQDAGAPPPAPNPTVVIKTAAKTADAPAKPAEVSTPPPEPKLAMPANGPASVYVIPIHGEIDTPQLYILRRALKDALENKVDTVVLDIDTLGGRMDVMLDMMDALSKFPGHTFSFIDDKAMSAGSFIAAATNEIYFKPGSSTIGAAAAVDSSGGDIDSTMRLKLNSYVEAKVRELTAGKRYRADVQRAMMDSDFELKIGDTVIKPKGELLTLTGEEACKTYGNPPERLLGAGLAPDVNSLLTKLYGSTNFNVHEFEPTWSESLAKFINAIAPILMGAGILLIMLEFKTPGFGVPGVAGVALLLIVFAGQYVAGLAGYEPVVLFFLGLVLIALELLVFTGSALCGILGILCFFGAFIWAMTDVWPNQSYGGVSLEALTQPMINVAIALVLAGVGFAILLRFLPKTSFYGSLVNLQSVSRDGPVVAAGGATATGATHLPEPGTRGVAMTDLRPLGEIEIAGARFQARAEHQNVDRGAQVEVVGRKDFALAVKAVAE